MAAATQYEALIQRLLQAAEEHPERVVVIDANTHQLLDSGIDPAQVFRRVAAIKRDKIPAIYKKPVRGEVYIL